MGLKFGLLIVFLVSTGLNCNRNDMKYSKDELCQSILKSDKALMKIQIDNYLKVFNDYTDQEYCFTELGNEISSLNCVEEIEMMKDMLWSDPPKKELFITSIDKKRYYLTINVTDNKMTLSQIKMN